MKKQNLTKTKIDRELRGWIETFEILKNRGETEVSVIGK